MMRNVRKEDFGRSGRSAFSIHSYDTTSTNGRVSVASIMVRNCNCRDDMVTTKGRKCQLYQLLALYLLPVFMYLIFNAQEIAASVQEYRVSLVTVDRDTTVTELDTILHQLQLERSTTVLYLSSGRNEEMRLQVEKTFNKTDYVVANTVSSKHANLSEFLVEIKNVRHIAVANNTNVTISSTQAMAVYSNVINTVLRVLSEDLSQSSAVPYWVLVASLEWMITANEQHGIEREMGISFFSDGQFEQWDEYFLFLESLLNGDQALAIVEEFGDVTTNGLMQNASGVAEDIEQLRLDLFSLDNSSASLLVAQEWFRNMTIYINELHRIANNNAELILERAFTYGKETARYVWQITALTLFQILLTPLIIRSVYTTVKAVHASFLSLKEKSRLLRQQKQRSDRLLNSMLPKAVSEELKRTGTVQTEAFEECTIYFSDIVGFTKISSRLSPMEVIAMLNALYSLFDARVNAYDCYKVETIGDAYMVVSGIPTRNGTKHVSEMASLALDLQTQISFLSVPHRPDQKMKMRIGLHTGPCVAGVVGTTMPRYCLFGMTVGIAAKMESHGQEDKIHISETTYDKLMASGKYEAIERGIIKVKDAGDMKTYWLLGKKQLLTTPSVSSTRQSSPRDTSIC
ncbi:uncharacterized protein LOC144451196 [Glandiceps talaboti]